MKCLSVKTPYYLRVTRTRVHELAKEFGVESGWVLARFKDLGEFVKSASSTVPLEAEMRFRKEIGERLQSGQPPEAVAAASATRRGKRREPLPPPKPKPPRRTSWDDSAFPPEVAEMWRQQGLGEADAPLALYLLENGILPEDLALDLRGRSAAVRLREGFDSRSVLVKEILEARSSAPPVRREPPSTKAVHRRHVGD